MNEKTKKIWISAFILSLISLLVTYVGSILMFLDTHDVYESGRHTSDYYLYTVPNPEAGILPCVGCILTTVAIVFLCISIKKHFFSIGSIILSFGAQILFYVSICIVWGFDIAYIGYIICVSGGGLLFVAAILEITYIALLNKNKMQTKKEIPSPMENQDKEKVFPQIDNQDTPSFIDVLKTLKELLDTGVLTQEEFDLEKKKILNNDNYYQKNQY